MRHKGNRPIAVEHWSTPNCVASTTSLRVRKWNTHVEKIDVVVVVMSD